MLNYGMQLIKGMKKREIRDQGVIDNLQLWAD